MDFTSISESAELAEGTLEMCFNITITDDNEIESTESFTVQLLRDAFTEDYVILSPNETTVVIQDNDSMFQRNMFHMLFHTIVTPA